MEPPRRLHHSASIPIAGHGAYLYLNQTRTRLKEVNSQFVLDGRLANLADVVRALNTMLLANGIPQHDLNPAWVVSVPA